MGAASGVIEGIEIWAMDMVEGEGGIECHGAGTTMAHIPWAVEWACTLAAEALAGDMVAWEEVLW